MFNDRRGITATSARRAHHVYSYTLVRITIRVVCSGAVKVPRCVYGSRRKKKGPREDNEDNKGHSRYPRGRGELNDFSWPGQFRNAINICVLRGNAYYDDTSSAFPVRNEIRQIKGRFRAHTTGPEIFNAVKNKQSRDISFEMFLGFVQPCFFIYLFVSRLIIVRLTTRTDGGRRVSTRRELISSQLSLGRVCDSCCFRFALFPREIARRIGYAHERRLNAQCRTISSQGNH